MVVMPGYGIETLYGVQPPVLKVGITTSTTVVLSWAHAAVGFELQSTATLTPPINWLADTNTLMISNNVVTVNSIINAGRFYRLVLP
jgi:hypothetical protein